MTDFETVWRSSLRFRRASAELKPLLQAVYDAMSDPTSIASALETLFTFLTSASGRTDANCSVTHNFIEATEEQWRELPAPVRAILDDASGALHDSIYAPNIARTFESTPEQLLERLRKLD